MVRATAFFRCVIAAAAVAASPLVSASTLTWPGSPGCTGTLQGCIEASGPGDTIEIASDTPVDEDLSIGDRSLSLTSAAYHHAALAAGRSIDGATSPAAGAVSVSVSRLGLRDGHIALSYAGAATATYDLRELDIAQSIGGASANIRLAATSGTVGATVYHNRIVATPGNIDGGLIEIAPHGAAMNVYAAFNTLVRADHANTDGGAIFVDVAGVGGTAASGYFAAFGNVVRGGFDRGAIFFSEGLFSSTSSAFAARAYANAIGCGGDASGQGIGLAVNDGSIDLQVINNTISGCEIGIGALLWEGGTTGTYSGPVWNNLVVANRGLVLTPSATDAVTNDYNLINAASNIATLGAHTITAPAQLAGSMSPRLSAGSPAIDAADATTLAFGLIDNGFPVLDADGLRRVKLGGADIGAYEYGDVTFDHVASAANVFGNVTVIDDPATDGNAGALLFPTRKAVYGAGTSDHTFGIWYSAPSWTIYNEDFTQAVDAGAAWNVFVPAAGDGAFVHTGTVANTSGSLTTIDNPMTNGLADRIVLVRHDWTRDGTYLDHPVGVSYSGSGSGARWSIGNIDQAAMPAGMGFDVYAQPPSPNAFRIAAPTGSNGVQIDHPLINGVACADVHVTRVYDPAFPAQTVDYDVEYYAGNGTWNIMSTEGFVGATAFNVVIDPAQVEACTDRIFADGFGG